MKRYDNLLPPPPLSVDNALTRFVSRFPTFHAMILPTIFFMYCATIKAAIGLIANEQWISASVDITALEQATWLEKESHSVTNLRQCIGLGTTLDWVYLACFSTVTKLCTIWEINSIGHGDVVKDPTLGVTECKTIRRNIGNFGINSHRNKWK